MGAQAPLLNKIRKIAVKSKVFSYVKKFRYKNSLRRDLKFIKKSRVRNDRRAVPQTLKFSSNFEILPNIICVNNGAWGII